MRKDGSYVKVERIAQIRKEIVKGFPEPVDFEKLKLWIECSIGLSEEKAEQYIEKAVSSGGWFIIDGKIVSEIASV
jgi:hypothetical protein